MTIATILVCDATHANIGHLPLGRAAGYVTGSPDIAWTSADWAAHPGAVRIDQTPAATAWDGTADVDDYENGAVGLVQLAHRAKVRLATFAAGTRPGQRHPAVYCSRSAVTPVVNALTAGGVMSGVGLWIADWNGDQAAAAAEVEGGSGPFPVIGRQYRNAGLYDVSVFSAAWLDEVSAAPPARPPAAQPPKAAAPPGMKVTAPPPGTWKQGSKVIAAGLGPEGTALWITTTADGKTWTGPVRL